MALQTLGNVMKTLMGWALTSSCRSNILVRLCRENWGHRGLVEDVACGTSNHGEVSIYIPKLPTGVLWPKPSVAYPGHVVVP